MAQENSQTSVASSSASANSWWEIHANSLSAWSTTNQWPQSSHRSNSSCDEDLSISNTNSFANASNHSGLSMNSPSADLSEEPAENQLWNHVLLNAGSGRDMHNHHEDGENFLEVLTSKSLTTAQILDPACDYLKKMDSSFGFANPLSLNRFDKQFSNYNESTIQDERLTKNLSDLVSNWSLAPPNPQLHHHNIAPSSCNIPITPMVQYSTSNITPIKHEVPNSPSTSYMPYFDNNIKGGSQHQDMEAPTSFLRPPNSNGIRHQIGPNNSSAGFSNKFCAGVTELPLPNTRSLSDLISFNGCLNKQSMDLRPSTSYLKGSNSSDSRMQGYDNLSTRGNGRNSTATAEGKKKRSDDSTETLLKKSKHENSTISSLKLQAPKVKMADKITALQQLVSPFGKTDTASVLLETINCIRILQEQVQLLSDPYMKTSASKDHSSWGEMERKDKAEAKLNLRSKGLCLVPVSCIPQVHRENCGPDYWMPTYRSCLYR